jgi:peptidyl-prolyl cis-trans isomerase-like 4
LLKPLSSPTRPPDNSTQISKDEDPLATSLPEEEEGQIRRAKAAAASALTLEMVRDLLFANIRPPKTSYLFVNLILLLENIFSWFNVIISCQVIRDKCTGKYAFIEYDKQEDREQVLFFFS